MTDHAIDAEPTDSRRRPSRQALRACSRQRAKAAKATVKARQQPSVLVVSPQAFAFAQSLPVHFTIDGWVQSAPPRGRWQLATGDWLTYRDLNCWHEVAHAVILLSRGWHVWFLRQISDTDPATVGLDNRCSAQAPASFDPLRQQHDAALSAVAGPEAVSMGMAGTGLVGYHYGQDLSGPDQAAVDRYITELGVPPSEADAVVQSLRDEAAALLVQHRGAFGSLVAALIAHGTLNAFEIARVWRSGEFTFSGRIGELIRCPTRDALTDPQAADPAFCSVLRTRFGCVAAERNRRGLT